MELRGEIPTVSLKHSLEFSFKVWCWNSVEYEWDNMLRIFSKYLYKKKVHATIILARKHGLHSNLNVLWSVMAFSVLFNELFYCQIWKLVGNGHNQVNCVKLDEYCKYNEVRGQNQIQGIKDIT